MINILIALLTVFQSTFDSDIPAKIQESTPIQFLLKQEINQTKNRFNSIINTWILAAILVPTSATLCVLVLAIKYGRKAQSVSSNITTLKSETVSEMKSLLTQEQNLTNTINSLLNESQENIKKLQNMKNDENRKNGAE